MADLLQDIKAFFVANGIEASLVYRDFMPEKPDKVATIYEYQGNSPIAQIAGSTRSVQIVTRAASSTESKALAKQLHALLESEDGDIKLTEERWALVHLRQTPFKLKTDDSKREQYVFNVGVTTYND